MTERFDPSWPYVPVRVRLSGPLAETTRVFALDTGATWTVVRPGLLRFLGYDVAEGRDRINIVTASGATTVQRIEVTSVDALGKRISGMPVLCHQLPAPIRVGGLLGLDFLRGRRLEIDFTRGTVDLR